MTEETNQHKIHVPITANENIDSVSTGKITGPSWDPTAGLHRQQAIEKARQEAWQDHQKKLEEANPLVMRVAFLEAVVSQLQTELKELQRNAS